MSPQAQTIGTNSGVGPAGRARSPRYGAAVDAGRVPGTQRDRAARARAPKRPAEAPAISTAARAPTAFWTERDGPGLARPAPVPVALGRRRGALIAAGLGLNALGAVAAWQGLLPHGASPSGGLLVGLLLGLYGRPRGARRPDERGEPRSVAHFLFTVAWATGQALQGAAWCVAFPGTRLLPAAQLAGAALFGAGLGPLAAAVTRSRARSVAARTQLADQAARWLSVGRQGPFGRLHWLFEGLGKVGLVGGALGLGPWLMVPATVALGLEWGMRAVALGVFRGCATSVAAHDLHASYQLSAVGCVGAGAAVQLCSVDWATLAAALGALGGRP